MNQLREAIEAKKHSIIHQLIKSDLIPSHDSTIKDLTLSELEWMLKHLKKSKSKG